MHTSVSRAAPVLLNCRASPRAAIPRSLGSWQRDGSDATKSVSPPCASCRVQRNRKESRMRDLSVIDGIGFVAAALVLATFCMRSMTALRWVALASNLAFIAYAYLGNLAPVLLLHALLLPVNACRLAQLCSGQARREPSEKRGERATATVNGSLFRRSATVLCRIPDSPECNAHTSAAQTQWSCGSRSRSRFRNCGEER